MAVADEHEYGEFILLMSYGQSTAEEFWAFAGIALRTCLAPFCRSLTLCKKNVTLAPVRTELLLLRSCFEIDENY